MKFKFWNRAFDPEHIIDTNKFGNVKKNEIWIKFKIDDSIFQNEKFDHIYQNNNIYSRKINDETIFMTLIDNFFISSNRDLIIENIIRDLKSNKKLDSELLKISKTLDTNEPFNILVRSKDFSNSNFMLRNISTFPKVKSSWIGYDFQKIFLHPSGWGW